MGFLLDEKKFINDNIFMYEKRMDSQYTKFLDKAPNFVYYYHINNVTSTADNGFQGIERIIGPNSPIKFKLIKDLPVYGIDPINLNLSDEDQGLDSSFDSDLIILPNTIKPLPNDCFIFSYLDQNYIFMVTEVQYDTIKSNNYYKISYTIKSLTPELKAGLDLQVDDKYICDISNIGTKEKCIIREEDTKLLMLLNDIYKDIVYKYKTLFYNKRYNSFMFMDSIGDNGVPMSVIYDKYLHNFINANKLFNEKNNYETLYCTNEDDSITFPIEYEQSIFRIIEKNKKNLLKPIIYIKKPIQYIDSVFKYYRDKTVSSIAFTTAGISYIDPDFTARVISGEKLPEDNIVQTLIIDYFNDNTKTIYNIPLDQLSQTDDYINYSFETFVMMPILLFILKYHYTNFMTIK